MMEVETCCDRHSTCYGCPFEFGPSDPKLRCRSNFMCLEHWKHGLRKFENPQNPEQTRFWAWNRPMDADDVRYLLREYICEEPAQESHHGILVFTGTHGDRCGRSNFDSPNPKLPEAKHTQEDHQTVEWLERQQLHNGWEIYIRDNRRFETGGQPWELVKYIKERPHIKHVIWAFCNAAAGDDATQSTSMRVVARGVYGFPPDKAMRWLVQNFESH